MKEIKLTRGYVALVDDADYEVLSIYNWHACVGSNGNIYARRNLPREGKRRSQIFMHVEIMKPYANEEVDHQDNNTLNNQRGNLRCCTKKQNRYNRRSTVGKSPYKGVSKSGDRWRAQLTKDGRHEHLGMYDTDYEAAKAYDAAAIKFFGQFAGLNFPEIPEQPERVQ